MLIATYEMGRLKGKRVLFERDVLKLSTGSVISAATLIQADGRGELAWASDELRRWLFEYAEYQTKTGQESPSFFQKLPTWAKLLFAIFYPVSVPYAVYRMWKTERYNQPARIAISAVAAVFLLLALTVATTPSAETSSDTAVPPVADKIESPKPTPSQPVTEAEPAPPTPQEVLGLQEATVIRVVDGDTAVLRVEKTGAEEKVRFIGIDTPESTTETEPYGKEASSYTEEQLSGKKVWLETDAELRDKYGRLLAYLWMESPEISVDGTVASDEVVAHMFNAWLVKEGFAQLMTIPPNVKYAEVFRTELAQARTEERGLWLPKVSAESPKPPPPAPKPKPKPAPKTTTPSVTVYITDTGSKYHVGSCRYLSKSKHPISLEDAKAAYDP